MYNNTNSNTLKAKHWPPNITPEELKEFSAY